LVGLGEHCFPLTDLVRREKIEGEGNSVKCLKVQPPSFRFVSVFINVREMCPLKE
uniref:DUF4283 domain-containing protein n=1 Tax=Taenia asiatica TaxID=60517 RepID=A0A0R3WC04_TAEAS